MNVTLPENEKYSKKDKAIYLTAIIVCLVTIVGLVIVELRSGTSVNEMLFKDGKLEEKALGEKTEEEVDALQEEFEKKFVNETERKSANLSIKKIDNNRDIVTTDTQVKESKSGSYDVNVLLPMINIDTSVAKEINKEIEQSFKNKLSSVMKTPDKDIKYSTEYIASISGDVLSLMIRSYLKEGNNAQRTIIRAYNYDIKNNKRITLEELVKSKNLDTNTVQQTITAEIESSQKRVENLDEMGFPIYNRNPKDSRYLISNSDQFYYTGNTIYIIYSYGDDEYTSEMDVVVI